VNVTACYKPIKSTSIVSKQAVFVMQSGHSLLPFWLQIINSLECRHVGMYNERIDLLARIVGRR
jgi:hypothetical protein